VGDEEPSLVDLYLDLRRADAETPWWNWPAEFLAVCDWGCNIYSCLDCTWTAYPVLTHEYVEGSMEASYVPT
jgi:hypothetical protein